MKVGQPRPVVSLHVRYLYCNTIRGPWIKRFCVIFFFFESGLFSIHIEC